MKRLRDKPKNLPGVGPMPAPKSEYGCDPNASGKPAKKRKVRR